MNRFRWICIGIGGWICLLSAAQERPPLETRVYSVSHYFGTFPNLWEASINRVPADPFAVPEFVPREKIPENAEEYLAEAGVIFGQGAEASLDTSSGKLTVRNTVDELERVEMVLEMMRTEGECQVSVHVEWIEVHHPSFSEWLFENRMNSDGTELRNRVQEWIEAGEAEVIDSATVLGRSGERAKTESVDAFTYPTDYAPPKVPKKLVLKDGAELPVTPPVPTDFTTRNLGTTLEVDPLVSPDRIVVDLNLSPEIDQLESDAPSKENEKDPPFKIQMPTFYSMKITTVATTLHGRYVFLGTTRPLKSTNPDRKNAIVLQFVRADVASTADWSRID